jgi:hypothetical protein
MEDWSDLQIDGLDTANGAFDLSEAFIGPGDDVVSSTAATERPGVAAGPSE